SELWGRLAHDRPLRRETTLTQRAYRHVTALSSFTLDEPQAKSAFDAQVATRHAAVRRGCYANDLVVLDAQRQGAADAAVRADGVGDRLLRFVPGALGAQRVLLREHQRAR